jgi:acyl-CoA reductase-like NAD-dependent aldehyde dehydrogenase
MEYIDIGRREGAQIVCGGDVVDGKGYFIHPTVFAGADANSRIAREEIFGPVLVVNAFEDLDEVIRFANDTRYGLGAGVFTRDVNKAHLIAERLQAGNVWVNCYGIVHPTMPFGGYKESGWGREMSTDGLDAFLETKSVFVQLDE